MIIRLLIFASLALLVLSQYGNHGFDVVAVDAVDSELQDSP